jgi:hypothetical protein
MEHAEMTIPVLKTDTYKRKQYSPATTEFHQFRDQPCLLIYLLRFRDE